MSYILDALKKMEHEKARKARKAGMSSISGELFMDAGQQSAKGGVRKMVALVVVTSLIAIGATWFFLRPVENRGVAKPHPVNSAAPLVAVAPPVVPAVQSAPASPSLTPSAQQSVAPKSKSPVVADFSPIAADSAPIKSDQNAKERRKERKSQSAPPVAEQRLPASGAGVSADIRVSGIAWQDERSVRRAVVNGFLMKEGGVVAGARIVEILQDRVRFSQSGRDFELSMVVTGSPSAAK